MNEFDVRFAFHMDTGNMPLWSYNYWRHKTLRNGHPTSEYGQWLEERAGNYRYLRRAFQFENENHISATYKSIYAHETLEVFTKQYVFWLEERILSRHSGLIKDILHLP